MNSTIAKAYVQILPTTKGIKSNIASELSGEMTSAGESSGSSFGSSLVSKMKTVIVSAGLAKALSESLNAGAALQQSLGGVETLFKDSAGSVIANAKNAYKTAGMSANEYMETVTSFSASLLQGLSGNTEKAASVADMALTDMSDNANKFGSDIEGIQNAYQGFAKQNYTMLDNLKLGYGGTKTEMERLLADAQKLSGVEYDITNLADVYEAIHVIQEEMGVTGTTAKESASTFSGSLASMKAAATNVLASLSLGEDITPSLIALSETVFTFIKGNLLPMVGNVLKGLPEILRSTLSMAIRGLNLVAYNADSIVQMGIELVTGIGGAIITALPYLVEAAVNIVTALGSAIISTDWAQIGADTMSALRSSLDQAAGEILGTDGDIVGSVLTAITTYLPSVLEGGVAIIGKLANGIFQNLPVVINAVGAICSKLLQGILSVAPTVMTNGFTLIQNLATGLLNNLPAVISSVASILAGLLAEIAGHLPELLEIGISLISKMAAGLIAAIPKVIAAVPQILKSIVNSFTSYNWSSIGSNIISGIANGIRYGVSTIISAAKSAAASALSAAKKALGIASPSKVMRDEVGKYIPAGIAVGIEKNTDTLTGAINNLSYLTTNSFQTSLRMDSFKVPSVAAEKKIGAANFVFNIYASEGQDVENLANIIMDKIQFEVDRREAAVA